MCAAVNTGANGRGTANIGVSAVAPAAAATTPPQWDKITWVFKSDDVKLTNGRVVLPGMNTFRLAPTQSIGEFRMDFKANEMQSCWRNCFLVRVGTEPPGDPPSNKLPASLDSLENLRAYQEIAGPIRANTNNQTFRLEGVIVVNDVAQPVQFYQIADAVAGGRPLLILSVPPLPDENPDGSAVGNGSTD